MNFLALSPSRSNFSFPLQSKFVSMFIVTVMIFWTHSMKNFPVLLPWSWSDIEFRCLYISRHGHSSGILLEFLETLESVGILSFYACFFAVCSVSLSMLTLFFSSPSLFSFECSFNFDISAKYWWLSRCHSTCPVSHSKYFLDASTNNYILPSYCPNFWSLKSPPRFLFKYPTAYWHFCDHFTGIIRWKPWNVCSLSFLSIFHN